MIFLHNNLVLKHHKENIILLCSKRREKCNRMPKMVHILKIICQLIVILTKNFTNVVKKSVFSWIVSYIFRLCVAVMENTVVPVGIHVMFLRAHVPKVTYRQNGL